MKSLGDNFTSIRFQERTAVAITLKTSLADFGARCEGFVGLEGVAWSALTMHSGTSVPGKDGSTVAEPNVGESQPRSTESARQGV